MVASSVRIADIGHRDPDVGRHLSAEWKVHHRQDTGEDRCRGKDTFGCSSRRDPETGAAGNPPGQRRERLSLDVQDHHQPGLEPVGKRRRNRETCNLPRGPAHLCHLDDIQENRHLHCLTTLRAHQHPDHPGLCPPRRFCPIRCDGRTQRVVRLLQIPKASPTVATV